MLLAPAPRLRATTEIQAGLLGGEALPESGKGPQKSTGTASARMEGDEIAGTFYNLCETDSANRDKGGGSRLIVLVFISTLREERGNDTIARIQAPNR
jgi:hypothetical protein